MIQSQCHTYLMEVISTLCFGASTPTAGVMEELMVIAFDRSDESLCWHKPNQPQVVALQSFLLQMLLKYE